MAANHTGTINKVILIGEISHYPRWHKQDTGGAALCFTLTTREVFSQKGQQSEHTEEHSVRLPGHIRDHELELGQWVHIEGSIKTTSFIDGHAIKRYKTEVVALRIEQLGRR